MRFSLGLSLETAPRAAIVGVVLANQRFAFFGFLLEAERPDGHGTQTRPRLN